MNLDTIVHGRLELCGQARRDPRLEQGAVRDVLGRLHERGIIAKTPSSHWIVGPLTAESVRERFQVRRLLEPEALRLAGDRIDLEKIAQSLQRERIRDPAKQGAADVKAAADKAADAAKKDASGH